MRLMRLYARSTYAIAAGLLIYALFSVPLSVPTVTASYITQPDIIINITEHLPRLGLLALIASFFAAIGLWVMSLYVNDKHRVRFEKKYAGQIVIGTFLLSVILVLCSGAIITSLQWYKYKQFSSVPEATKLVIGEEGIEVPYGLFHGDSVLLLNSNPKAYSLMQNKPFLYIAWEDIASWEVKTVNTYRAKTGGSTFHTYNLELKGSSQLNPPLSHVRINRHPFAAYDKKIIDYAMDKIKGRVYLRGEILN